MNAVQLVDRTFFVGVASAVYAVKTENAGTVFMCVNRTNYYNEERSVVIADAGRLLTAWKKSIGPSWLGAVHRVVDPVRRALGHPIPPRDGWLPHLSKAAWRRDYKFEHAAVGFAQGRGNPVPLANAGLVSWDSAAINFNNGKTRTIWLLANGASAFPIECSRKSADAMARICGVPGAPTATVAELLGDLSWEEWIQENGERIQREFMAGLVSPTW